MPQPSDTPLATFDASHADPGFALSDELSQGEEDQITASVAFLNDAARRTGLELAIEVRDHVLDTYFASSYEAFADPSSTKERSFRALCEREDLELSRQQLYTLVRVGEQATQLPAGIGRALSVRHHRALLAVADDDRASLAARAAAEGWTVHALEQAAANAKPEDAKGRKASPPLVKGVSGLRSALARMPKIRAKEVQALSKSQRNALRKALTTIQQQAAELAAALAED